MSDYENIQRHKMGTYDSLSAGSLLGTSVSSLVPVFFLIAIGIFAVKRKIIDENGVKCLSNLINWILVPCMFFVNLGGKLSVDIFRETWVLAVAGGLSVLLNFLISFFVLLPLAQPSPNFSRWFVFGLSFPNVVAIPLVFVNTICSKLKIERPAYLDGNDNHDAEIDHLGRLLTRGNRTQVRYLSEDMCVERGQLYVFVYIILPTLVMFIVANRLKKPAQRIEGVEETPEDSTHSQCHENVEYTDAQTSFVLPKTFSDTPSHPPSQIVEEVDQVELSLKENPESLNGSLSRNLALEVPPIDVENPDTASSNGTHSTASSATATDTENSVYSKQRRPRFAKGISNGRGSISKRVKANFADVFLQPSVASQLIAITVGLVEPLHDFFFSSDSFMAPLVSTPEILAQAVVPIVNLSLASSLGLKISRTSWSNFFGGSEHEVGITRRTLVAFVFGRMVLLPGVSYLLLYFLLPYMPDDKLLRLIIFFETAMPSANMCVVLATFNNCHREGEILSLSMVHQYLVAVLSMSLWCFVALYLIL